MGSGGLDLGSTDDEWYCANHSRCKADDIDLVIRLWVTGITGYTLAVDVNTRGCDSGTTGVL